MFKTLKLLLSQTQGKRVEILSVFSEKGIPPLNFILLRINNYANSWHTSSGFTSLGYFYTLLTELQQPEQTKNLHGEKLWFGKCIFKKQILIANVEALEDF